MTVYFAMKTFQQRNKEKGSKEETEGKDVYRTHTIVTAAMKRRLKTITS